MSLLLIEIVEKQQLIHALATATLSTIVMGMPLKILQLGCPVL
jgi:hypothetical protein